MGKFNANTHSCEPYSALVEAFTDLCVLMSQNDQYDEMKNVLQQSSLGTEMRILTKLVSKLPSTKMNQDNGVDEEDSMMEDHSPQLLQQQQERTHFTRFKLLYRTFLHSVASSSEPVVLFFDDLHWVDEGEGSLRVLEGLINDMDSGHVLIMGAYHEEAIQGNPLLQEIVLRTTNSSSSNGPANSSFLLRGTLLQLGGH